MIKEKNIMNSTTKNTLIESVKIVVKLIAGLVGVLAVWYGIAQAYVAFGYADFKSEFYAWLTLLVPLIIYGFFSVIWSEAKHRVWKRENNIE